MNSLDIDSASTNSGAYRSHQIIIKFTGGSHKGMMRGGTTHTVTVPYNCLSKKLQSIHRLGGKITDVTISNLQLDVSFDVLKIDSLIQPLIEPLKVSEEILTIAAPIIDLIDLPLESVDEAIVDEASVEHNPESIPENNPEPIVEPLTEKTQPLVIEEKIEEKIENVIEDVEDVIEEIETPVEIVVESDVEINIATAPEIECAAPLPTSKKSKSSAKSGQGFNKPKNDNIQATRSTRKPKS
jgi:hypothetical protein